MGELGKRTPWPNCRCTTCSWAWARGFSQQSWHSARDRSGVCRTTSCYYCSRPPKPPLHAAIPSTTATAGTAATTGVNSGLVSISGVVWGVSVTHGFGFARASQSHTTYFYHIAEHTALSYFELRMKVTRTGKVQMSRYLYICVSDCSHEPYPFASCFLVIHRSENCSLSCRKNCNKGCTPTPRVLLLRLLRFTKPESEEDKCDVVVVLFKTPGLTLHGLAVLILGLILQGYRDENGDERGVC